MAAIRILTKQELLENLCYYDKRNPDSNVDDDDIEMHKRDIKKSNRGSCSCDNCFYGRVEMANELLKLKYNI